MKHNRCHRLDISWVGFSFRALQYTLRFLYMSGDSLFYLDKAVQSPGVSNFWRGKAERKEKCFNFTHGCKPLNCFKPSVTWGEVLLFIWKRRLKDNNMSDKKSWNLWSHLAVYSIPCNWSLCSVFPAWQPRTLVKAIVSKKLLKFFANVFMTCPAK